MIFGQIVQPYENPQQTWSFFIAFVDRRKGG